MTAITALRRQLDAPPLSTRTQIAAAALVEDARALALEWSQGSDLSMISRQAVADRNALALVLTAARQMLTEQGHDDMAELIKAYLAGEDAGNDFAAYDRNDRLDRAAEAVRGHAEVIAEAFEGEIAE
jgi:hypothetical protein